MICPLYRGCPLLRGSNCIILIGRDKFGDLVLSFVERYLIQCPFLGGSSLRGSTVFIYAYIKIKLTGGLENCEGSRMKVEEQKVAK